MKIFEFIKKEEAQKEIYKTVPTISINDIFKVKEYVPYAQKVGVALKVFSDNYNDVFDYINARIHIVYRFLELYSDLDFSTDDEEVDVDGLYDFMVSSGCLELIKIKINKEWVEVNNILLDLVEMKNREALNKDSLSDFLGDISSKNPEDIDKMIQQVEKLSSDKNVQKMMEFKSEAVK